MLPSETSNSNERNRMKRNEAPIEWETIFQAIGHPALLLDPQHNVIAANNASIRLTGRSQNEIIGKKCFEIFHAPGADTPPECCAMQKMLASGRLETSEIEMEFHGGVFKVTCTPIFDEQGNLDKILHIATDITGLKRAEKELRENEVKFRAIFENSIDAIGVTKDGVVLFVNPAYLSLFGYTSSAELVGTSIQKLVAPEERERVIEYNRRRARKEDAPRVYEARGLRKDGTEFDMDVHVSSYPLDGEIYSLVILRDITERRRTEQRIAESLQFNQAIVSTSPIGIFTYQASGPCVSANESAAQIVGTTVNSLLSQNFHKIESWKRSGLYAVAMEALKTDRSVSSEIHLITTFHADKWVYAVCTPFLSAGEPHLLLMLKDITDRKHVEAALTEARGFSADLLRSSAAAAFVLDRSHRIMLWNKACEELTGCSESEMIGTRDQWKPFYGYERPTVADVIIDNDLGHLPELYENYSQSALNPQGIKAEGWYKNLGGKDRYIIYEASPIYSSTGELIAAIETLQDYTESKRLEKQLLQSQKMEAIGILAGGVAHDFNNILSAIVGYSHLTLAKMLPDDPLKGNMDAILQAAERATSLTQSLLSFSRKQVISPKCVGLNDIVLSFETFLTRLIREDIKIVTTCTGGDLTIFADRGQIEQLLMNIVTNARDAMPMGGTVAIRTRPTQIDRQFIEERGFGQEGPYALLTISDTGEGMDAETKRKMFEPFFTTKAPGKGTGLGLSTVYGIVKQNAGFIDVNSEPGKGTSFEIYLPLVEGVAAQECKETSDIPVTGGSETILIAEDNETLRELFSTILKHHGYRVIVAVDGDDAVNKFRENKDRVQLAILDGIMPKKNGREAYNELRAINPSLKAIFVSGYAEDVITREGLLEQNINFSQKPVPPTVLLKKVRDVLDA
jgi:two-component system cell cycle sensor histidine kinase/response regulator CckA